MVIRITQEARYLGVKEGDWVDVVLKKRKYPADEEEDPEED